MAPSAHAQSRHSLGSTRRAGRSSPLRAGAAPSHAVQFYDSDDYLSETIASFLADGLSGGQPVIAVATEPHLRAMLYALQGKGIALGRARASGQLTLLDAEETLSTFMDGGLPDAMRFRSSIGGLLEATGAGRPGVTICVYGEMVDVLWRAGNPAGAIRLEELWNDLADTYSFSLVCSYGMGSFASEAHSAALHAICRQHRLVIPTESYTQADEDAQPLEITLLQQRAQALETEIERRRELERSLRKALASAEDANRVKSEFLAVMSHELRTPLNAIAGHVQLIEMGLHGPITEAQRDALGRVQRNQHHLLALINDLLNLSRAEAGRVDLFLEEIPVEALLSDVARTIEPLLLAGHLTCSIDGQPGGGAEENAIVIRADRERVNQILLNLLSNAIKFTPAGGHIAMRATRHPTIQRMARIQVCDTGIDIPESKLDRIFEPFVQLRTHALGQGDGVGLGLAISRTLARAMGGDLTAESEEKAGATLTLTLPLA
ncbi:MAG: ATP-binding protein [Gemmatimonadota bacterium]|nr:ATP-binding protein [Gemmatimonadota bacterium]